MGRLRLRKPIPEDVRTLCAMDSISEKVMYSLLAVSHVKVAVDGERIVGYSACVVDRTQCAIASLITTDAAQTKAARALFTTIRRFAKKHGATMCTAVPKRDSGLENVILEWLGFEDYPELVTPCALSDGSDTKIPPEYRPMRYTL